MSDAYWKFWNPQVQDRIDRDIEKNRKADGELRLTDIAQGTEAVIEQISHDFIFGAHIFNYNQLGKTEYNEKYKGLYGTLFNSATIAFYWKAFETQPDRPRFREEYWDTEAYWNRVEEPLKEPHWRRPPTDPVVEFCESKGIRLHGHTLVWGNRKWQYPPWIDKDSTNQTPEFAGKIAGLQAKRITEIANRYKGRIHSWDIVNESAKDYEAGVLRAGGDLCKSWYGVMPGNYDIKAFDVAKKVFPEDVLFNINDYHTGKAYADQTTELLSLGHKIDILGSQTHRLGTRGSRRASEGEEIESPEIVWNKINTLSGPGLPIHISEITIASPDSSARGGIIQAILAHNMYRLWFSLEPVMGVTWWNVVDACGAPGESTTSGLFTRRMEPKPSFHALNNLITKEWKTKTTAKPDKNGQIKFRGFKGNYRVTWIDSLGNTQTKEYYLK